MQPDIYWVEKPDPHCLAIMPRPRSGDWLAEEIAGWRQAGLKVIVSLLEATEVQDLALSDEPDLCKSEGLEFVSFPIVDRGVPASLSETSTLINDLVSRIRAEQPVGVHCRAGIGRSGLISACVLLRLGVPYSQVFPVLSHARGVSVPDTPVQADWVKRFAESGAGAL